MHRSPSLVALVSDISMTRGTCRPVFCLWISTDVHVSHQLPVTTLTILQRNRFVFLANLYWLWKVAQGECLAVVPAIEGFCVIFTKKVVWHMTVVARRNVSMARVLPGLVLRLHHMAIDTGLWITRKVRPPFGVLKSKQPESDHQAQQRQGDCNHNIGSQSNLLHYWSF